MSGHYMGRRDSHSEAIVQNGCGVYDNVLFMLSSFLTPTVSSRLHCFLRDGFILRYFQSSAGRRREQDRMRRQ